MGKVLGVAKQSGVDERTKNSSLESHLPLTITREDFCLVHVQMAKHFNFNKRCKVKMATILRKSDLQE